ncbi:MAG: methyltransferase domain-containing protein [Acidobacteria bacterium]|nr:methyltransferase domain-containing protein [Acidobacteriota bacterium]
MNDTIIPREAARAWKPSLLQGLAKGLVERRLEALPLGEITLLDGQDLKRFGRPGELRAAVTVHDPAFYLDVALGGSLGAAEAYIQGRWSCDDLTQLCRIFARNLDVTDELERGWARLLTPLAKGFHWLRRNTRAGSEKNIRAHYDLGNELFQLFLDPTMNYSCGLFESPDASMEEASLAKMDHICRKLDLRPEDHLLEIGSGWGALAMHAAAWYGCRVTTTTISREQHRLATERVRAAGLEGRVTVLLCDYRDLEGRFDKIVSVEMIEAVGHEFLPEYFRACGRLLEPDGLLLIQGITMGDDRYAAYRKGVDFIQRYVFPGSCLPSVTALCAAAGEASDLRPAHLEDLTPHYAETLRRWRGAFFQNLDAVRRLGYSEAFVRLWEYYLCYCEAGFEEGTCGDVQILFARPRRRRDTVRLGQARATEAACAAR